MYANRKEGFVKTSVANCEDVPGWGKEFEMDRCKFLTLI